MCPVIMSGRSIRIELEEQAARPQAVRLSLLAPRNVITPRSHAATAAVELAYDAAMKARALVLDYAHRVLLVRGGEGLELLRAEARDGERVLPALERVARERLGLALPAPCGARPLLGSPFELVYIVDRAAIPAREGPAEGDSEARWVPLHAMARHAPADADAAWQLYTDAVLGGFQPPRRELVVFAFGHGAEEAARLAHLVVKGTKRATTGWVEATRLEGKALPVPGSLGIVTDGFGIPLCAIRTERVELRRFGDVGPDVARAEGEGDRSLEEWRDTHRAFFVRQGDACGLTFTDDATVYCEFFRRVQVLARPG